MADWIDRLVTGLKDDAKQKNLEHAIKLRNDAIIAERTPDFWKELRTAVRELAGEMNEKLGASLGGIHSATSDRERFKVWSSSPVASCTVTGTLSGTHVRFLTIETGYAGTSTAMHLQRPSKKVYKFVVGPNDEVCVTWEGRESYTDPREMASEILRQAFTDALFVPY